MILLKHDQHYYRDLLKSGAQFRAENLRTIEVSGGDRLDFLHRLTSQHFKGAQAGDSLPGAFLNAAGMVIALFDALVVETSILLLVTSTAEAKVLAHLDKFLFREKVAFKSLSVDWYKAYVNSQFQLKEGPFEDLKLLDFNESKAFHYLLLEPQDQIDVNEKTILLESGLRDHVHPNKGCYPGQEVIERMTSYGRIPRKLVGLVSSSKDETESKEIFKSQQKVGFVTSSFKFSDGSLRYLAYVLTAQIQKENRFALGDQELRIEILPDQSRDKVTDASRP